MEYGNLAYKLDVSEREEKTNKEKPRRQKVQKLNFRIVFFAVLLSFAAYFMISKQVAVFETSREAKNLRSRLEEMQSTEIQKNFELEQSVDMEEIEEIATTRLNMQRPEQGQKVYVNVTGSDVTEITSREAESVKNKLSGAADLVKKNIIGIFSVAW